ncbi:MAG TPA: RNA 2',3'-cyclic phosphodiesterase [Clostridia bacterium]|nr:RNA 2',3'-cyclic phosphodiesterase [Clostridia bacterium]
MRLFIAVTFPESVKDYLAKQETVLRRFCHRYNFTRRDNFHLTVKFLGEVGVDRLPEVTKAMDQAAVGMKPFKLTLSRWGCFDRGSRKLLWIGVEGDLSSFARLFYRVEELVEPLGFPRENRKLTAHITMAREAVLKEDWEKVSAALTVEPKVIPVNGITLMESTRLNGVLTYIPLYEKKF